MPGWTKHKLESRLPGEISIISDVQMTPPFTERREELKSLKFGLKFNIQKMKILASSPITSWQIDEETKKTVVVQSISHV